MIVAVWPDRACRCCRGYGVVQAPLFETKAMPTGVGSVMTTVSRGEGPLLVTMMV